MSQMKNNLDGSSIKFSLIALAVSQSILLSAGVGAATINVDPPGTPGGCTIEEAISTANSNAPSVTCIQGSGADTIALPANTIFNLSTSFTGGFAGNSALPPITSTITINGNGSTLRPDPSIYTTFTRAVEVVSSSTLTLNNTTVADALSGRGAGILSDNSTIFLNDCVVRDTNGTTSGGAIVIIGGSLTMEDSIVTDNLGANGPGGGIYAESGAYIKVLNSEISDNWAIGYGGGVYASQSTIIIENSLLTNNTAQAGGGAIHADDYSLVTIVDSTISSNGASSGSGGAIRASGTSAITINSSTLANNSASSTGGSGHAEGYSSIGFHNSTASANLAQSKGGAFYLSSSYLNSRNSTITQNRITSPGPFVAVDSGGGIYRRTSFGGGITLVNTVVAKNGNSVNDCGGVKPGLGTNNWFEDSSCAGFLNAQGDPKLGGLLNNGGPTKTHAPLPGSGLVGAGDSSACNASPINNIDQRGQTRNNPCFIGAVDDVIDPSSFFVVPLPNGKSVIFSL